MARSGCFWAFYGRRIDGFNVFVSFLPVALEKQNRACNVCAFILYIEAGLSL